MTDKPPAREAEETPDAQLTELHLDERGLEFRMKHPIVPIMAEYLAEAFKDAGGVNYVAFDVNCEDIGPLVLIMQRRLGETPEMQVRRMRATLATTQAERDALATELASLRTPATDEALVEAAAMRIWSVFRVWGPPIREDKPTWERLGEANKRLAREMARAVLATAQATHARQADTITRLTREHAEVVARLEVMRAEVVGLRTPATDEALVEAAAKAAFPATFLLPRINLYKASYDDAYAKTRAVLAAVGPALVDAERERCAKIGDARSEVLLAARNTVPKIRGELERGATEVRGIAAAIRTGAPDAR